MRCTLYRALAVVACVHVSCAGSDRRVTQTHPQPTIVDAAVAIADAPPDAPLPLDQDPQRLATRDIAMLQAVAAALADTGSDCAAAATRLAGVRNDFDDVVAADTQVIADERRTGLKAALATRRTDLAGAAQAVYASATLTACASDAEFERAFDRAMGQP